MYQNIEEYVNKLESYNNSTIQKIMTMLNGKKNSPIKIADLVVESKTEEELLEKLENFKSN